MSFTSIVLGLQQQISEIQLIVEVNPGGTAAYFEDID